MASTSPGALPDTGEDRLGAIRRWLDDEMNGYTDDQWDECAGAAIGHIRTLLEMLASARSDAQAAEEREARLIEAMRDGDSAKDGA